MDNHRFATLAHALTSIPSRRHVLHGLAGLGLALGASWLPEAVDAKKKRKKRKGKKKEKTPPPPTTPPPPPPPPQPNAFGCLDVGQVCQSGEQCCSGICRSEAGTSTCADHNTGGCQAEFDACQTLVIQCGTGGYCFRTTGNASFCGGKGIECGPCSKDADCEAVHGPGAACVVCDDCLPISGGTTVCYPPAA